jgi:hypothetical protein
MRWFALLLICAAFVPSSIDAQGARGRRPSFPFPFVDEAGQDPDFQAFRHRVLAAVRARDPRIGEVMTPALRKKVGDWLALPRSTFIGDQEQREWGELEHALALGGAFTMTRGAVDGRREFCAPYVYAAFPNVAPRPIESTFGPYAIIGDQVPARAKPRPDAPVVTSLSWELVKAFGWLDADPQSRLQWAEVDLLDGRRGYVQEGQIRHPTDYRVCFAKIDGRWLMTAFGRGQYPAIQ